MMIRKLAWTMALLAVLASGPARADYLYTTFDVPDLGGATGIDDSGRVAGTTGSFSEGQESGFIRGADGSLTSFGVPGYALTQAHAINDAGQVAGYTGNASGGSVSYVRNADGSLSTFSMPGSSDTEAFGINSAGQVVGYSGSSAFIRGTDGSFTSFSVSGSTSMQAAGINDAGQVSGNYTVTTLRPLTFNTHGFVRNADGSITSFDAPGATNKLGEASTAGWGINDAGQVSGFFEDSNNVTHGFVRNPDGSFTILDAPGSSPATGNGTLAYGINNAGQVVGVYSDANGNLHGFIATPPGGSPQNPVLPSLLSPGVFTFNNLALLANGLGTLTPLYVDPAVAVGYDFRVTSGPNFASVLLPTGIGDNRYELDLWNGSSYVFDAFLTGGIPFSFGGAGVDRFRIAGIDPAAGLDPTDPQAFVTGLTFVGAGTADLTMTPLIGGSAVPEPSSLILGATGLLGLLGYGWCHRMRVNLKAPHHDRREALR